MGKSYADIIKSKKKEWNCEELMDGARAARKCKLPFSSPLMNWCTYGGIPRNAISEFFGDPGCGKTSTAVDICKNAARIFKEEFDKEVAELTERIAKGDKTANSLLADLRDRGPKKVFYMDLEHSFDEAWSKVLGLSNSDIDVMQPPDVVAEDILQTLQELIETGEIGLAVVDSIPSLVPRAELEKKYGERTVAALAGLLAIFCRKIVPMLTRYNTTLIFINQTRDNMDNPYVVKTPGGKAPVFYASLRMLYKLGQPLDFLGNELPQSAENPAGYIVNAKIVKQKSAPFDRKNGSYYLMCQSGIREDMDYAKLAVNKYGIIRKGGAWFTMCDPYTGEVLEDDTGNLVKINGMAKVYDYLQANTEYFEKIKKFITDDINNNTTDELSEDESYGE